MTEQTEGRPEIVTDEHLTYLDELRESGETNMFGARPYVAEEFALEDKDAAAVLKYWMQTFESFHYQDGTR
tara:strand:+ start:830 stop:1042 length:213 start_codon:yes stop_codon:yes gene_type:complete